MKPILKSGQRYKTRMAKNLKKSLQEVLAQLEDEQLLKQQTEMFWYLQLQFLDMGRHNARCIFWDLKFGNNYVKNKHTKKMLTCLGRLSSSWTQEEFECLCTHFALQLAGVEE